MRKRDEDNNEEGEEKEKINQPLTRSSTKLGAILCYYSVTDNGHAKFTPAFVNWMRKL
jgi:hypothetical protein